MKQTAMLMGVLLVFPTAAQAIDWDWGEDEEGDPTSDGFHWDWDQDVEQEDTGPSKGLGTELRLGVKGVFPASLWTAPDDAPPVLPFDLYWNRGQFFIGWGAGGFLEVFLLKFLSLELDCLFEDNSLAFNQTFQAPSWTDPLEWDYYTRFKQLRFPLLVKGRLALSEKLEVSVGLGPEFVLGLDADVTTTRRTVLVVGNEAADRTLAELYQADKANGLALDVDLGVGIKVWKLIIPISLRAGFNLLQPAAYDDRVTVNVDDTVPLLGTAVSKGKVKAIESFNFALLAGVGYVTGAESFK